MTDSVDYINSLLSTSGAPFHCSYVEMKGRVLTLDREVHAGEILFSGPLLHKVSEDIRHPVYIELIRIFHMDTSDSLDYSPMWYWCGMNSLSSPLFKSVPIISEDKARQLKMLYHPDIKAPSPTVRRIVQALQVFLEFSPSDEQLLELDKMTLIWTLNCFEHADDPLTYASFFLPSFMSHSCAPTAMWTTIGDTFFIRAQRRMSAREELTVSYLSEEFGLRPIGNRRNHLQSTKFFLCDCPRCTSPVDDTRGFKIPSRFGLSAGCHVKFPRFVECSCGCGSSVSMSEAEINELKNLESQLVNLVYAYDGSDDEDGVSPRPDGALVGSDESASELYSLIDRMGIFHWASIRGLYQLAEYYKAIAAYPLAIKATKMRIYGKRDFVKMSPPEMSSGLAWALEDLGDLILLHVSGSVVAGLSEEARERFCDNWNPRSPEDLEILMHSGAHEAYSEATSILSNVFGADHEHTKTAEAKLNRLMSRLSKVF